MQSLKIRLKLYMLKLLIITLTQVEKLMKSLLHKDKLIDKNLPITRILILHVHYS